MFLIRLRKFHLFFNLPYNSQGIWSANFWISSVAQSCPTLWDPMNRSTPGLPVHDKLLEFTQTHTYRVGGTIQPSHPQSSSSSPAPNPSQHQGLFQWANSSHEVAKVLEFQLQQFLDREVFFCFVISSPCLKGWMGHILFYSSFFFFEILCEGFIFFFKIWWDSLGKQFEPGMLCEKVSTISLFVIGLFRFSMSSWVSFTSLYFSRICLFRLG